MYISLLQREKVADVSAKQIYDRLRSSRMTDEVLLTVFEDKRLRHRFVGDGAFDVPRKQSVLQNIISVLGTPHPPQAVPLPPLGKAWFGRFLVLQG